MNGQRGLRQLDGVSIPLWKDAGMRFRFGELECHKSKDQKHSGEFHYRLAGRIKPDIGIC